MSWQGKGSDAGVTYKCQVCEAWVGACGVPRQSRPAQIAPGGSKRLSNANDSQFQVNRGRERFSIDRRSPL